MCTSALLSSKPRVHCFPKPPKPRKQSKRKPHVLLKLVPQPSSYNNNANFNGAGAQPEGAPYSARGGASAAATAPAAGAQPSQTAAPLSGRQTPSQGGAAAAMPVVNTGPHAAKDHAPLGAGAPASVPRETPPSAEVKAEDGTPFRGHEAPQRPEPADAFEEEHEHGEEERGAAFERALSVPPGNGPTRRYFDPFDQSDSDLSDTEDELADVQVSAKVIELPTNVQFREAVKRCLCFSPTFFQIFLPTLPTQHLCRTPCATRA